MVAAVGVNLLEGKSLCPQLAHVVARGGKNLVKDFGHRCSLNAVVFKGNTVDVVRHGTSLAVCRPRKRYSSLGAVHKIVDLNGVSDGVNIFNDLAARAVHDFIGFGGDNVPSWPQL